MNKNHYSKMNKERKVKDRQSKIKMRGGRRVGKLLVINQCRILLTNVVV